MTSTLPELNIAKTPIYESLVATSGDPYQYDGPSGGWPAPAVSTDFGAANEILGRLLAQGGADGQGWVAVVLVGGPAAAQLSQQLAQGTGAGLPGSYSGGYDPLTAYQALQAMQALQSQGRPWSQPELPYSVTAQALPSPGMPAPPPAPLAFEAGPSGYQPGYGFQSRATATTPAVTDDPIAASMASNMAAGIVLNALQASSPSGSGYDQYGGQPGSQRDPYAASSLTPAPAYLGTMPANPLDSIGQYPAVPQSETGMSGTGIGMAADPAGQYAAMQAQMQAQAQAQAQLETSGQHTAVPQPEMGMSGMGTGMAADPAGQYAAMPTMAFPPGAIPMTPGAYPGYPGAAYAAMAQSAAGRDREEDFADGRLGRIASAVRALRGR